MEMRKLLQDNVLRVIIEDQACPEHTEGKVPHTACGQEALNGSPVSCTAHITTASPGGWMEQLAWWRIGHNVKVWNWQF